MGSVSSVALALLACLCLILPHPARAEECVCHVSGPIDIGNFPQVQPVIVNSVSETVNVRETEWTRTYSKVFELGAGEKRRFGPLPLDGRHRMTVQASLLYPRTLIAQPPLLVKWLVRFHAEDPFFDPCAEESEGCRTGFAGLGLSLRMAPPAQLSDLLEGEPLTPAAVSTGSLQVLGTEGLLVLDNSKLGARTVRVQVVLDR